MARKTHIASDSDNVIGNRFRLVHKRVPRPALALCASSNKTLPMGELKMQREFKRYEVTIYVNLRQVTAKTMIEASSPCKAVELLFQDNPKLSIRPNVLATAVVKTSVGIRFEFTIMGDDYDARNGGVPPMEVS